METSSVAVTKDGREEGWGGGGGGCTSTMNKFQVTHKCKNTGCTFLCHRAHTGAELFLLIEGFVWGGGGGRGEGGASGYSNIISFRSQH